METPSSWPFWTLSALLALISLAQGFIPLMSLMDYEGSLTLAFFTSLLFGAATAIKGAQMPQLHYWEVLKDVLWFLLPAFTLKLISARLTGQCSWSSAMKFFFMYPVLSAVVAGAAGFAVSTVIKRPLWAALTTVGIVATSLVINLWELYSQPVVYSYDPFFGYFSGAFYDTAVDITPAFMWSRAHDILGSLLAVTLAYGYRSGAPWWPAALISVAFLGLHLNQERLEFATSWNSMHRALPLYASSKNVRLYASPQIPEERRKALFKEIIFNYSELQKFFKGAPSRLDVYLFRSPAQKRRLFGAENVEIAKPWQMAVFITDDGNFPHGTLRHEMAHVFAGIHGDPLFRIASKNLVPNPGIIEGAAVAASFATPSGDYHQKALVLIRMKPDITPDMVFGARFYALPSSQAYTLAGSFLRYLYDTRGPEKFFTLYRTGSFKTAYPEPLPSMWQDWKSFLKERITLTDYLKAAATAKFQRPALHTIPCLHEAARQVRKIWLLWGDRKHRAARRLLLSALESLPHVHFLLTTCIAVGDSLTSLRCARQLAARPEPHLRALGLLEMAYASAHDGDFDRARELISHLPLLPPALHRRRKLLEMALTSDEGRTLLRTLEKTDSKKDLADKLHDLGTPLAMYLAGSMYLAENAWPKAVEAFSRINPSKLPDGEFRCEYLRRATTAAVFAGNYSGAGDFLDSVTCNRSESLDRQLRRFLNFWHHHAQRSWRTEHPLI